MEKIPMTRAGHAALEAAPEVVALEHPRHRLVRRQAHQVGGRHRAHPLAVEADLRALGVEHRADLIDVGAGVRLDLLAAQRRARLRAARGITYGPDGYLYLNSTMPSSRRCSCGFTTCA